MDFDGLVTEHSFTYPEQHYSNEASVLIEDDFFVGDVVEIFSSPRRSSPPRSVDRASEHPDLDQNALRIVEEVIMAAEVAVTTNLDKTKRFHGRVVQGKTIVKLKDILTIYNRYKAELCIDTILDSKLYTFLMDLDLIPEENWWSKLDTVLNSAGSTTREMIKREDVDTEENKEFAESYHQLTMMQNSFEAWKTALAMGKRKVAAQPLLAFSLLRWIRNSSLPIQIMFDSRRKILKTYGLPPRISDRLDIPSDEGLKMASKAMGAMHAWLLRKLFLAWYEHTQRVLMLRLKWVRRRRNVIFTVWKEFTITQQYHRRTLKEWGGRWEIPFKRFMLQKLKFRVKDHKLQLVLHAKKANERRILMTAFIIWYDQWELKRRLARFISRWKNMGLLKTFDRWVAYTDEQKEYKMKINKSMRRLKNATLTNAFDGWYSVTYAQKEEHRKLKKVTAWFVQGSMAKAFNSWASNVHKLIQERKVVNRFIYNMKTRDARKAFNTWYDTIHKWKYNRLVIEKHRRYRDEVSLEKHFYLWYTEIKHERIIKRHLRQSNWNKAICIFDEWKMETKELKLLYRKLESERRYTTKFRVFRHWRVRTIKWKARKYLLKLGAKHKRQQDIYRTLNVWNRFAKKKSIFKKQNMEAKKFLLRLHRRRVFQGFLNNLTICRRLRTFFLRGLIVTKFWTLPDMFYAWRQYTKKKRAGSWLYMSKFKILKALNLWRERLKTTKQYRAYYARGKLLLLKNIKRKFWENWKVFVEQQLEGKDERLKRENSFKRFSKKSAIRWLHEYTVNVRAWRYNVKRAKLFNRKMLLKLFFNEWSSLVVLHKNTSSLRKKVHRTYLKQCLNTWKEYIVGAKQENARQASAARLHDKLSARRAIRFWHKYAEGRLHMYECDSKALSFNRIRLLRYGLYNGFRSLLFKKRMMEQAETIHGNMRKKEMFKYWSDYCAWCQHKRKLLRIFSRRQMNKYFGAWKKFYNVSMSKKTKSRKAEERMKDYKRHFAIMQWRTFTHRSIDARLVKKHYNACEKFLKLNRRFRYLSICLKNWHDIVVRRKYVDACSIVVLQRQRRKSLYKTFESWRSICVNYNVDSDISETLQDVSEDEFEVEEKELDIDGSELTNVIFEEEALKEL